MIQEEQGIVGDAVVRGRVSEETDLLLQVVSLPHRKPTELLEGHPKDAEELPLRQVSLRGRQQVFKYKTTMKHTDR